jgi:hypothetical protein
MLIEFREAETQLINYLKSKGFISLSKFRKISGLSKNNAEWVLAKLITIGILTYEISEERCIYLPSE